MADLNSTSKIVIVARQLSCGILIGAMAAPIHAQPPKGLVPVGDVVLPNTIPNTPSYLVDPNGPSNFYFGGWTVNANGVPEGHALPPGLTAGASIGEADFYQRFITDDATGDTYIQLIITGEADAGEDFNDVGMFSEVYVKMHETGASIFQGMHCGQASGNCLPNNYTESSLANYVDPKIIIDHPELIVNDPNAMTAEEKLLFEKVILDPAYLMENPGLIKDPVLLSDILQTLKNDPNYFPAPPKIQALETNLDSLSMIRTDAFEDPKEKFRLKQLIYSVFQFDDVNKTFSFSPDLWADYPLNKTVGPSFFTDIWGGSYDYKGINLGDFTHTVVKNQDIDPRYSYSMLSAEMKFRLDNEDLAMAKAIANIDNITPTSQYYREASVLAEAQRLVDYSPDFTTLEQAVDYILREIEYKVVAQEGWRDFSSAGLLKHESYQVTMQGAVVEPGNVVYSDQFFYPNNTNPPETISSSWGAGDRIEAYGVVQDLGFQQLGHEQVVGINWGGSLLGPKVAYFFDDCDKIAQTDFELASRCSALTRYNFVLGLPIYSSENYDVAVGDQFKIEGADFIDPFDPFATQPPP